MKTKNLNYLTKEFRSIAVAAGLLIAGTAGLLYAGGAAAVTSHDLIAGQNNDEPVGTVTVEFVEFVDDIYIPTFTPTHAKVTYVMTSSEWCLTAIHIDVAETLDVDETLDEFAVNKKGNPKIGEFDYVDEDIDCVDKYTAIFSLPHDQCIGEKVYVAAHAVVSDVSLHVMEALVNPGYDIEGLCENDDGGIETILQIPQTMEPETNAQSYVATDVFGKDGAEFGEFEGWCLDPKHMIWSWKYYSCNFLWADAMSLDGIIPFSENMGHVMWILNQEFVGESSTLCGEVYTSDDVQHAIWDYMLNDLDPDDPTFPEEGPDLPFEVECRSHEIRDSALAHGDHQPKAGDLYGIACDTINPDTCQPTDVQDTIFTFRTYKDETAWGFGDLFVEGRSSWATYITESCPVTLE